MPGRTQSANSDECRAMLAKRIVVGILLCSTQASTVFSEDTSMLPESACKAIYGPLLCQEEPVSLLQMSKGQVKRTTAELKRTRSGRTTSNTHKRDESSGIGALETAGFLGLVCAGLQLFGPDHLCTLMSLGSSSVTSSSWPTLCLAAAWGAAHSTGTIIICILLQLLRGKGIVNAEAWEHYGDYFVGVSLIMCAVYFATRESYFLKADSDGTVTVQGCECHPGLGNKKKPVLDLPADVPPLKTATRNTPRGNATSNRRGIRLCSDSFTRAKCHGSSDGSFLEPSAAEGFDDAPDMVLLLGKKTGAQQARASSSVAWLGGASLGLLQGLCCPMALASINLMTFSPTPPAVAMFVTTYAVATIAGAVLFSLAWFHLTRSALGQFISPVVLYRGSCAATLVFGVFWITMNRFDALEALDFTQTLVAATVSSVKPSTISAG